MQRLKIRSSFGPLAFAVLALTASSARAQIKLLTVHGTEADLFGQAAQPLGDINGDGVSDFVVGAMRESSHGSASGEAIVFSGSDGSVLYRFYGDAANDAFGAHVGSAGDVNHDGTPDIVVGSNYFSASDTTGAARVFSGKDGSLLYTFYGQADISNGGCTVAGVGDINGDGYDDVLVGEPGCQLVNHGGRVRVYSGFDGSILSEHIGALGDQMGSSVAAAGDVNHDGRPDFVVGGYSTSFIGNVWVFSGGDGSLLHKLTGANPFDVFGHCVAGAGDVNGDGFGDIIVGAPEDSTFATAAGSATVFSGADFSVLYTYHGANPTSSFGMAVAAGGDYDGDGHADFLISAVPQMQGYSTGSDFVNLYSGLDGHLIRSMISGQGNDGFGAAIGVMGDVDGDGELDYLVSSFLENRFTHLVSVYVLSLDGHNISKYCTSTPNSTGAAGTLDGSGYATYLNNDLTLTASHLPKNQSGLFIASKAQGMSTLGNGFLCLAPKVWRAQPILSSGLSGSVTRNISENDYPWYALIHPGDTWNFQFWYRDTPAGGAGFNLTDAVSVTFLP